MVACKVDYCKIPYEKIIEYYFNNRKISARMASRQKPFAEVKETLLEEFVDLEFKVLKCIQFDFEFDLPFKHLEFFRDHYFYKMLLPAIPYLHKYDEQLRMGYTCKDEVL